MIHLKNALMHFGVLVSRMARLTAKAAFFISGTLDQFIVKVTQPTA